MTVRFRAERSFRVRHRSSSKMPLCGSRECARGFLAEPQVRDFCDPAQSCHSGMHVRRATALDRRAGHGLKRSLLESTFATVRWGSYRSGFRDNRKFHLRHWKSVGGAFANARGRDQQLLLQLATAGNGDINVRMPNPTPTIRAIATPNARTKRFIVPLFRKLRFKIGKATMLA